MNLEHQHECSHCLLNWKCERGFCSPWIPGEVTQKMCADCKGLLIIRDEVERQFEARMGKFA